MHAALRNLVEPVRPEVFDQGRDDVLLLSPPGGLDVLGAEILIVADGELRECGDLAMKTIWIVVAERDKSNRFDRFASALVP
jgi:hypothetical protein